MLRTYLIFLLLVYAFVLGYILMAGYLQGLETVKNGLMLWATGGAFGLMAYQLINRGNNAKTKHESFRYYD